MITLLHLTVPDVLSLAAVFLAGLLFGGLCVWRMRVGWARSRRR